MKYICECCNYSTDVNSNLKRHYRSKSHLNIKSNFDSAHNHTEDHPDLHINDSDDSKNKIGKDKTYLCLACQSDFSTKFSLTRHSKNCQLIKIESAKADEVNKVELNELKKQVEKLQMELLICQKDKEHLEDKINILERTSNDYKGLVNDAGSFAKSALNFVSTNFKEAPGLTKFDNFGIFETEDDYSIAETAIYQHSKGKLDKYIGKLLLEQYKIEDPKQQSLWNSDSSRLTYLIKEIINDRSEWIVDKNAVKVKHYIIKPILDFIQEELRTYVKVLFKKMLKKPDEKKLEKMGEANKVIYDIDNKDIDKEIIKYITPHFHLDKNKNYLKLKTTSSNQLEH